MLPQSTASEKAIFRTCKTEELKAHISTRPCQRCAFLPKVSLNIAKFNVALSHDRKKYIIIMKRVLNKNLLLGSDLQLSTCRHFLPHFQG